jgi:hypothetical protein
MCWIIGCGVWGRGGLYRLGGIASQLDFQRKTQLICGLNYNYVVHWADFPYLSLSPKLRVRLFHA